MQSACLKGAKSGGAVYNGAYPWCLLILDRVFEHNTLGVLHCHSAVQALPSRR